MPRDSGVESRDCALPAGVGDVGRPRLGTARATATAERSLHLRRRLQLKSSLGTRRSCADGIAHMSTGRDRLWRTATSWTAAQRDGSASFQQLTGRRLPVDAQHAADGRTATFAQMLGTASRRTASAQAAVRTRRRTAHSPRSSPDARRPDAEHRVARQPSFIVGALRRERELVPVRCSLSRLRPPVSGIPLERRSVRRRPARCSSIPYHQRLRVPGSDTRALHLSRNRAAGFDVTFGPGEALPRTPMLGSRMKEDSNAGQRRRPHRDQGPSHR